MSTYDDARLALNFEFEVRTAFAEIASRHQLAEVGSDPYSVVFQGPPGWLTVLHDRVSFELDISLEPSAEPKPSRPYGMSDLIRATDPERAARYRCFAATSAAAVHSGVRELARDFARHGETALVGDSTHLARLEQLRAAAIEHFAKDRIRARDAERATEAVRREDWRTVVELYEPIEDELDKVQAKRLEVARKRLKE